MFSIFSNKKDKDVFQEHYRPSWEESARQWQENHIAHKKLAERVKKELGSNTLPRI